MKSVRLLVVVTVVLAAGFSFAQSQPNVDNGFKPWGSYDGSNLDSINLMDANFLLHAPVGPNNQQRGKLNPQLLLYITSRNWSSRCQTGSTNGALFNCFWGYGGTGISFEFTGELSVRRQLLKESDGGNILYTVNGYTLITWDGATHQLRDTSDGSFTSLETVDGTGYHVGMTNPDSNGLPTTAIVSDRDGNQYQTSQSGGRCSKPAISMPQNVGGHAMLYDSYTTSSTSCEEYFTIQKATDSNGNQITGFSSAGIPATDTLGRTAWPLYSAQSSDATGCAATLPFAYSQFMTYTSAGGVTNTIKICTGTLNLSTNFGVPNIAEIQNNPIGYPTTFQHVTTVILADGTKWTFSYDSYGNITNMTLPQGGSISYNWINFTAPESSACPSAPSLRVIQQRTLTDVNGHAAFWTYQWGTAQSDGTLTNVVTDAYGNDTVHVFSTVPSTAVACQKSETSTIYYQGSRTAGHLLKRVDTSYGLAGTFLSTLSNPMPTDIKTTVYPSGKVSLVHKDYDPGPVAGYSYGNVVAEKVYDWGQGSPGTLLRETDTQYQWQADGTGAYQAAHLIDLPAVVTVKDGSGCTLSKTSYGYDEYPLQPSNLSTAQQLVAAPNGVRGNQTSVNKFVWNLATSGCAAVPSTPSVISHTHWYDSGEPYQSSDPLGHTTTHTYDAPVYWGAYPTQTCNALNQCVSATYDFNAGLMLSFTNANATLQSSGATPGDSAHTTSYVYDFMDRLLSATQPPDTDGAQAVTSLAYPSPTETDRTTSITASLTGHVSTFSDGLGRTIQAQHTTPDGISKVDTTFDQAGRPSTVSNPYYSSSESTYGTTQSSYDALGRVTSTTKQDNSVGSASYNIVTSISGTGDCSISTDEAGKQRGSCTDALGRLVEVDEPTGNPVQAQNYVTLQSDSNFVVYNQAGNALWQSGTAGLNAPSIYMQDDGNLVLYTLRWMAGTYTTPVAGSYPQSACSIGTYLTRGEFLPSGKCITSPHGEYFLLMNTDGNLFIYDWYRAVGTWGPGTQGHPGAYAIFQTDGNFVVYDANGTTVLWQSGTSGTNAERLDLLDDSRLMIWKSVWNSGTSNGQFGGTAIAHPACDIGNGTGWTGVVGAGSCLVSPNGRFEMLMQTDGNLAIYDRSVNPPVGLWSVGTNISPADPGVAMRTLYSYDALGNLLCVEQHGSASTGTGCSASASSDATSPWRVRRFTYDSLSRLLTATNPESGQISYSYDADGNMLQKTSPVPNQTGAATQIISYCYDALHRIVAKGYGALSCPIAPGSAAVSYVYDQGTNGIGHLSSLTDQAGSASYSYDVLGRLSSEQRTIAGVSKSMSYAYNLDGSLKSLTYPSGAVVTYTPDSAGRVLSAVDSGNNINYVTGATYDAGNALTGFVSGQSNSFAGITNSFSFNKRLQPVNMSASSPSQTVFSIGYDFHFGNGNNGNVYGITNYKDANRNQTFTYDALNRLATAQNAGTDCTVHLPDGHTEYWGNSYSYDAWGNLLQKTVKKCSAENMNISADGHNWIHTITGADYTYDAAGNMTYNATSGQGYTYDQENRITGLSGYGYTYDGDGNRVIKTTTATPATGTLYWYMTPGIVAESDLSGAIKSEYVFFDGERVARRDTNSGVFYYFSDHLKTASVETDASGNIKDESDFYPGGGELQFTSSNDNHYKFIGKEWDSESGLDYFGARYYASSMGRWMSPDWSASPEAIPYSHLDNPQSLNLYGYVLNNPVSKPDLDGHGCPPDCSTGNPVADFVGGLVNAWSSDNLGGAGRTNQTTVSGKLGQAIGDIGAALQGAGEMVVGTGGNVVGFTLDATGVGAAVGAPANVVSTAVTIHGYATTVVAMGKLAQSKTGPGSVPPGERAPQRTAKPAEKSQKLEEQGGKCANCEKPVKEGEGIGHHYPDRHADGGKDVVVVCEKCHKELHSGSK